MEYKKLLQATVNKNFESYYDEITDTVYNINWNLSASDPSTDEVDLVSVLAHELGLGINAGHDLSLENLKFFKQNIPNLAEVSIGHALISESLYLGLQNVVNMYKYRLQ